jgi:transaldolase
VDSRSQVMTMNPSVDSLRIKIFGDGADRKTMVSLAANPLIKGFTTNPTLMRKDGVTDYEGFAREVLAAISDRPISFEVLSDDLDEMERQARKIVAWGANANVKIPITNTQRVSTVPLIRKLAHDGIKVNVTGITTLAQVQAAGQALGEGKAYSIVSVFAGRIADTGRDPVPMMAEAVKILKPYPNVELLWASPRELLNIFQADEVGCQIITVTADVLKKLALVGKDLEQYSQETVQMFRDDAVKAGYVL